MPVPRPLYCCKDVLLDYPNPYKKTCLPISRFWDHHFLRPDLDLFCSVAFINFQNWDHPKTFSKPSESVSPTSLMTDYIITPSRSGHLTLRNFRIVGSIIFQNWKCSETFSEPRETVFPASLMTDIINPRTGISKKKLYVGKPDRAGEGG